MAQQSGAHSVQLLTDGGVRLFVDGSKVVDTWALGSAATAESRTARLTLAAGHLYAVTIEYAQQGSTNSRVSFRWALP